jgi:hypothetical protein
MTETDPALVITPQAFARPEQLAATPYKVEFLHNETLALPMSRPLMGRAEALDKHAVNGDILAVINLPVPEGAETRAIAVVDFGKFEPGNEPLRFILEGQPIKIMGKAPTRFGLRAISYTPSGHLGSDVPLYEGDTGFGRESKQGGDPSYALGLNEDKPSHTEISRDHMTVTLKEGHLSISDHSTNGTEVLLSPLAGSESDIAKRGLARFLKRSK